jgi:hypothetical protein
MNCFERVCQILYEWAVQVRGARGEVIADITTGAIKDLCGERCFALPEEFNSYIDDYRKREGALQAIADYRDHFVHPFHVFYLGYYILDQWREKKIMPLNLTENGDENLILKTWFVTSIYHDVGYPAEKLEVLVRDFFKTSVGREMSAQFDWSSVILADDNIKHIDELSDLFAQKAGDKKQAKIFEKWFHKRLLKEHDHGVLTALMLCNQGWEEKDLRNFVYESALAIALHSWRRVPNEQVEFDFGSLAVEDFPLAFYLSYCDSAQEWGRRVLLERMKKERVPFDVKGLDSRLEYIQVDPSETKVVLKYLANRNDPVTEDRDLEQVFNDVSKKFESTWYLKEESTIMFSIVGRDKDRVPIGGFAARHL